MNFKVSLLNFALSINVCFGFGYYTHGILGEMSKDYMSKEFPLQFNKMIELIGNNSFTEMSIWADKAKRTKEWSWTRNLHYIDILECNLDNNLETIVEKYCENKCITHALTNFTLQLKTNEFILENFKFMLHFTQDFNQPLHLYGVYRGGNSFKVIRNKNGRNRTMNYHYLWDSEIPEYFIKNYLNKSIKNFNYTPNPKIIKLNTIEEYTKYIYSILKVNMKIPCQEGFLDEYIIFENYFKEESMKILFDNYMSMIINTFLFLF